MEPWPCGWRDRRTHPFFAVTKAKAPWLTVPEGLRNKKLNAAVKNVLKTSKLLRLPRVVFNHQQFVDLKCHPFPVDNAIDFTNQLGLVKL